MRVSLTFLLHNSTESTGEERLISSKEINTIDRNYLSPISLMAFRNQLKIKKKALNQETVTTMKTRKLRVASPATNVEMIEALKRATRNILFNMKSVMKNKANTDAITTRHLMVWI